MSRSYRKAVYVDKGDCEYNKKFRRVNKQRIHEDKYPLKMNEVVNQYDVSDFKINFESQNNSYLRCCDDDEKQEYLYKLRRK